MAEARKTLIEKKVIVRDETGKISKGRLLQCPECESAHFLVIFVGRQRHQHMQCVRCGTSYCDGSCTQ